MRQSFFVPHDLQAPVSGAADGPLAGLTAVVKDMYDMAGYRTGGGSPEWLAEQQPATAHAAAIERILAAGATVVGKAICEELFYSLTGINAHYGMPPNLRAPGRVPGGSSSGSAAACGAGVCDFALGSDTAGSVRIPAAFNGLYGLRPTHGRVDMTGAMAMAPSFDVAGWFASTPGVFRRVGAVLLDDATQAAAAPNRLLVAGDAFTLVDEDIAELGRAFLKRAAALLPPTAEVNVLPKQYDAWCDALRTVQASEVWQSFGAFVERANPNLGPGIKERIEFAASVTPAQAAAGRLMIAAAREHLRGVVVPGTLIALPTAPSIAPRADVDADSLETFRSRAMRLTCLAGLAGLPQLCLPVGTVAGCPASLSLIGWPGADEVLLDLAVELGRHCGIVGA